MVFVNQTPSKKLLFFTFAKVYQDQGSLCEQLEQRKQDSTCVAEVQEAISEALVV